MFFTLTDCSTLESMEMEEEQVREEEEQVREEEEQVREEEEQDDGLHKRPQKRQKSEKSEKYFHHKSDMKYL